MSMQDVLFRPLFVLNFSRKARTWEGISFLQNLLRCLLRLTTSRPVNVNLELEGNNTINNNNNANTTTTTTTTNNNNNNNNNIYIAHFP